MLHVNLVKDSSKYKFLRKVSYVSSVVIISSVSVTFVIYLLMLLRLFFLQSAYNDLSSRLPEQINDTVVNPHNTTKSLYGYEKLRAVRKIYASGPEYFSQYDYLLGLIQRFKSISIDDLTLTAKNLAQLTVSSEQREELFNFIELLEKPDVRKSFVNVKLTNIILSAQSSKQKGKQVSVYSANFELQFQPVL
ncbi:MAG: hypothetical protein AAB893_01030 [Patescibacteria group bacterium]